MNRIGIKILVILCLTGASVCPKLMAIESDYPTDSDSSLRVLFELESGLKARERNPLVQKLLLPKEGAVSTVTPPTEFPKEIPVITNPSTVVENGENRLGVNEGAETDKKAPIIPPVMSAAVGGEVNSFANGNTDTSGTVQTPPGTGNMAALEEGIKTVENFGKLPLPVARLSKQEGNTDPNTAVGDLGGSPWGPYSGKTKFGSAREDDTLQGLMAKGGNDARADENNTANNFNGPLVPEGPSPHIDPAKIEALKQNMESLAEKKAPFEEHDYKAYAKARDLFFQDNYKLLKNIDKKDLDEDFVANARQLFHDFGSLDLQDKRKAGFADFYLRNDPSAIKFPFPIGKEPKPTTHREGRSH